MTSLIPDKAVGPAVASAEVRPVFSGPGRDEVVCEFPRLDATVTGSGVYYHVLWRVDGKYLYEDTNTTDQRLPSALANQIKDGTRVSPSLLKKNKNCVQGCFPNMMIT